MITIYCARCGRRCRHSPQYSERGSCCLRCWNEAEAKRLEKFAALHAPVARCAATALDARLREVRRNTSFVAVLSLDDHIRLYDSCHPERPWKDLTPRERSIIKLANNRLNVIERI